MSEVIEGGEIPESETRDLCYHRLRFRYAIDRRVNPLHPNSIFREIKVQQQMTERLLGARLLKQYIQCPCTILALLAGVSGVLMLRLFLFISRYAVNIMYWDQWDFYTPLFENRGPWQLFTWQVGPVREGIGLIVTAVLAKLTSWNSRGDAFTVGVFICLAMFCAFILRSRLWGTLGFFDLIIPFLFLTLFQWEAILVVPNLSYGAFPLVLVMLYGLVLCLHSPWKRYLLLLVLNFLLIYTGFGLFMGPLTIVLCSVDIWQSLHKHEPVVLVAIALVLALVSNLSFLISYRFNPAIPNFGFSISYLPQYPLFVGLMLAAFWGWHMTILGLFVPSIAGILVLITLLAILAYHCRRLAQQGVYSNRPSLVIATLIAFSLLFCFNTAIGRIPLGLRQAQVSRYLTLMIPGYLGCYFHLISIRPSTMRQFALSVYMAMSLVGSLPTGIIEAHALRVYENKINWKRCYLQLEDLEKCDQLTGQQIHLGTEGIPTKLEYLRVHHLNLYLETAD